MKSILLFIWVIFCQIFILNNIQFNGYINPYYYIIFILFLKKKIPSSTILILSFITGFTIDIFCDSYGIHTIASVLIGYLKILSTSRIDSEESHELYNMPIKRFIITISYFIFFHHFTLFFLEYYSFKEFFNIIKTTLLSGIFTLTLCIMHKMLNKSQL